MRSAIRCGKFSPGACDMVLSGGADAPIALGIVKGFILMKILTESLEWRAASEARVRFRLNRDGFVLAEGAWMFMLEEYEHAKARGANDPGRSLRIWIDLRGLSSRALEECGEEPARAIGLAMQEAASAAENVDYVNLHGTSTQLNDRIETRALKLALGETAHTRADVGAEVADRTSSGSLRSGRRCGNDRGHARRPDSADH